MRALILAAGEMNSQPKYSNFLNADFIIVADGGLKHAQTFGLKPDLLVGDFDSVDETSLAHYKDVPVKRFSTDKDLLDLEIALQEALRRNASELRVFGALGGRLDQTLAAITIAGRLCQEGITISLHGIQQDVFFLANQNHLTLNIDTGQVFSLLSLVKESVVSVSHAAYELKAFKLEFGVGRAVSNKAGPMPLEVNLSGGLVCLIIERSEST